MRPGRQPNRLKVKRPQFDPYTALTPHSQLSSTSTNLSELSARSTTKTARHNKDQNKAKQITTSNIEIVVVFALGP